MPFTACMPLTNVKMFHLMYKKRITFNREQAIFYSEFGVFNSLCVYHVVKWSIITVRIDL